jgi:hypothetical protein
MSTTTLWQGQLAKSHFAFALLTILMGAAATGCTQIRLIGDYDDTIDSGVTDVQLKAETYFAKLSSNSSSPMDPNFHEDIRARLTVLHTRATALPKYSIIADQLTALQSTFADFQKADEITPRPLHNDPNTNQPPLVSNTESAVTTSVESILKLELGLKRGDTPSNSSTTSKK